MQANLIIDLYIWIPYKISIFSRQKTSIAL
jgi:hypothetical protein